MEMSRVTVKSECLPLSDISCRKITTQSEREKQGAHCVYRVWREVWLRIAAFNGCLTVSSESESCRHRGTAQYRQSRMGLLMAARGLNKAQFICYISRFVTWFPTIPHISSVEPAMGVLYPSYFLYLSAHFKLLHVMMVFFSLSEFLPFCFQAENQIYKSKAMGERHGDWRAFKSFQSSQSFRERNKQEIKMELEMVAIPLFRVLKPGAFLNTSSCFIFCSIEKGSSSPLLIFLNTQRNYTVVVEKC